MKTGTIDLGDGRTASVAVLNYVDRIFVVVSELDTFGTIVSARKDVVLGGGTTYDTSVLLGKRDDPIPEIVARQLCEKVCSPEFSQDGSQPNDIDSVHCDKPLLLSFGIASRRGHATQCSVDMMDGKGGCRTMGTASTKDHDQGAMTYNSKCEDDELILTDTKELVSTIVNGVMRIVMGRDK